MWERIMSEATWKVRGREREEAVEAVTALEGQEFGSAVEVDDGSGQTEDMASWMEFLSCEADDSCLIDDSCLQRAARSAENQVSGSNGKVDRISCRIESENETQYGPWDASNEKECEDKGDQMENLEKACEESLSKDIATEKVHDCCLEEPNEMQNTDDSEGKLVETLRDEKDGDILCEENHVLKDEDICCEENQVQKDEDILCEENQVQKNEDILCEENHVQKDDMKQDQRTIKTDSVSNILPPYLQYVFQEEEEEEDDDEDDDDDDDDDDDEEEEEAEEEEDDDDDDESLALSLGEGDRERSLIKDHKCKKNDGDFSDMDDADPLSTKNEIEVVPKVPKVEAVLELHHKLLSLGSISSVLDKVIIVEGQEGHEPLNEGSILWLMEQKSPLGLVDEIFGPVKRPFYLVRFNSPEDVPNEAKEGVSIAYVPEFAITVVNNPDLYRKGYDASGDNDEDLSDNEAEFSDDEKEAKFKRSRENERKKGFVKDGDDANTIPQISGKRPFEKASNVVTPPRRQVEDHKRAFKGSPINTVIPRTADVPTMKPLPRSLERDGINLKEQTFPGSAAFKSPCFQAGKSSFENNVSEAFHFSHHLKSHLRDHSCSMIRRPSFAQASSHPARIPEGSVNKSIAHQFRPSQCAPSQFKGPRLPPYSPASEIRNNAIPYRRPDFQPNLQAGHEQNFVSRGPPNYRPLPEFRPVNSRTSAELRPPFESQTADVTQPQGRVTSGCIGPSQFGLQANTITGHHPSQYHQVMTSMANVGVQTNTHNQSAFQGAANVGLTHMVRPAQLLHVPGFPARADNGVGQLPGSNQGAIVPGFHAPTAQNSQQVVQRPLNGTLYPGNLPGNGTLYPGNIPGPISQWPPSQFAAQTPIRYQSSSQPTVQGLHTIGIPVLGTPINMGHGPQPLTYQGPPINFPSVAPPNDQFATQVHGQPFSVLHRPPY